MINLHGSIGKGMRTVCEQPGKATENNSPGATPCTSVLSTRILPGAVGCTDATAKAPAGAAGGAARGAAGSADGSADGGADGSADGGADWAAAALGGGAAGVGGADGGATALECAAVDAAG